MVNKNACSPGNLQSPTSLQITRLRALLSWGRAPQAPGEQSARCSLAPIDEMVLWHAPYILTRCSRAREVAAYFLAAAVVHRLHASMIYMDSSRQPCAQAISLSSLLNRPQRAWLLRPLYPPPVVALVALKGDESGLDFVLCRVQFVRKALGGCEPKAIICPKASLVCVGGYGALLWL